MKDEQRKILFEKYKLFEKMGQENFGVKLWILLKGIEAGDGKGVLITALGHAPCIAMLEDDRQPKEIRDILEELIEKQLIQWNNRNLVDIAKEYIVTFETSHELNKIIMQLKWQSYLRDGQQGAKLLTKLGYRDVDIGWFEILKNRGKKFIYFLNNNNGLATGEFVLSILSNQFD